MSKKRDKESDIAATRKKIRDSNRPKYLGGKNWLDHGPRGGKNAVIDDLLLEGATMVRLLKERNTEVSIRDHFQHLRIEHGLRVSKISEDRYRFDRESLGIPESTELVRSSATLGATSESRGSFFGAGGESKAHRTLKDFVASHPEILDLPASAGNGGTEVALPFFEPWRFQSLPTRCQCCA